MNTYIETSSSPRRVAVLGATGGTGRLVVRRLLDLGVAVTAISRREPHLPGTRSMAIDLVDTTVDDLAQAIDGADAVVFAAAGDSSRVDHRGAVMTIEAAEAVGVSRFVLLSGMGVGRERPAQFSGGFWNTYFGMKELAERRLRSSALDWTIVQPGELTDEPPVGTIRLAPTGDLPIDMVTRADVAALIVASLHTSAAVGRSWEILRGTTPITEAMTRAARLEDEGAHA